MKRFLSLFLAFVFAIGICFSAPVTIKASAAVENAGFRFYLNDDGTAYELCQIYDKTGKVTIPEKHNGLPVEKIDIYWQEGNDEITEIEFPSTLKEISGFNDFNSLTILTLPDGLEKITGFQNCSGLTEVTIPASVKEIGEFSFTECLNLQKVVIKGNIEKLGMQAFSNCTALSDITIEGSITEIGYNVFKETPFHNNSDNWVDNGLYIGKGLVAVKDTPTEFTVKDGTTAIAPGVFVGVEKLTLSDDLLIIPNSGLDGIKCETLEIPASVKKIDAEAVCMLGAENLTTLILNEGLEEIGDYAFYYAGKLKEVKIPDSVKVIGKNAFQAERLEIGSGAQGIDYTVLNELTELKITEGSDLGLENVDGVIYKGTEVIGCLKGTTGAHTVREGTTKISDYAFKGSAITGITIPDSVTVIGEGAFSECTALENVKLPADLTELPIKLFYGCSALKGVTIPEKVTKIGGLAFGFCSSITELTFPDSVVSMDYEIYLGNNCWEQIHNFEGCDKLERISYGANYDGKDAWSSLGDATNLKEVFISDKNKNCFERNGVVYTYSDYEGKTSVNKITYAFTGEFVIPKGMEKLWLEGELLYDRPIQSYVVEDGNEFYSAENGVLYNKDKTELISYVNNEETFTIPDTVTKINSYVFAGKENLREIIIPDSVTEIGEYAFSGCTNLEKVTMSKKVTAISNGTFSNCRNLKELPVNDSITEIGDYAFYNCSGLVNVVIPEPVKKIGIYAFTECMNLESVALNKNIKEIGFQAFANCGKLATITLDSEANILNIDRQVFSETEYSNNDANWYENGLYVGDYLFAVKGKVGNNFVFKDEVKNFGAVFSGNKNLTSIIIPDSVIALSDYAFADCTNLTSLTLGAKVDYFGEKVFGSRDRWNLLASPMGLKVDVGTNKNVVQNEALLCWNDKILLADKNYEGVVKFPEGITEIPEGLFYEGKITGVELPSTLVTIGRQAFSHCENLTGHIVFPDSVVNMYDEAFSFCTKIKKVTLSKNLRNKADIGNRSDDEYWLWFNQCTSLEEVIIPEGLNRISNGAFQGCTSLSNIEIPETVTSIGYLAFEQCNEIKNIIIPDSVTMIEGGAFQGCGNLQEIKLPKNLSRVSEKSFAGCAKLESVLLPVSIEEISESAFYGCINLKNVTVPENTTSIGEKALGYYNSSETVSQQSYSMRSTVEGFFSSPKLYLASDSEGDQKVEDFTIQGKKGSEAEKYARANRFEFVYVDDHTCSGGTATCTQKAVCSTCGEEYGELDKNKHAKLEKLKAEEPTCTESGFTEGEKCTACGVTTVEQEIIKELGHTTSVINKKDATCTADGYTGDTYCSVCKTTTVKGSTIKSKGHTEVTVKGKAATCTATGLTDGKKCSVCGTETVKQQVIAAKGHTTSVISKKSATCTADGYTGDTYCSTCKTTTVKGSTIKSKGHTEVTVTGKVATCTQAGLTDGKKCSVCGTVTKAQETIKAKGHTEVTVTGKAPTCTATGLTDGKKCSVCNTVTKAQETVKATGHNEVVIPAVAPTYTTVGKTEGKKCSVCGTITVAQKDVAKLTLATPVVTVKNSATGLKVSWKAIDGAESYKVYRKTYNTKTKKWGSWKTCGTVTTTSYVDTKAKSGTKYIYTVKALNGDIKSGIKDSSSILFLSQPTVKIANASTGVKVSWNKITGATGYKVYRSEYKNGKWSGWKSVKTITKGSTVSWTDKNAKSGVKYKYTVKAVNGKTGSTYKSSSSLLYLAQPKTTVKAVSNGVKVTWTQSTGATSYKIYRSEYNTKTKKWSGWKTIKTAKSTSKSYTDKTAKKGVKYRYTVKAVNGKTASTYKASSSVKR